MLLPLARMTRPSNALVAGVGAWAGALLAGAGLLPTWRVGLAIVASLAFAAAGNLRNDILDVELDRRAHPDRPLPRGLVTLRAAQRAAVLAYLVALLAGFLASPWVGLVVVLALPLMEGYERWGKALGLPGNLIIGALSAAPFVVGALALGQGVDAPVLALALLAALATVGREILKDVEDVEADRGARRTLPMRIGARGAALAALAFLVGTTLLSPLPMRGNVLAWAYVPAVALADAAFLSASFAGFSRVGWAQRLVKLGMVLALLALLVGRVQRLQGGA